jgi:hypothetical protein
MANGIRSRHALSTEGSWSMSEHEPDLWVVLLKVKLDMETSREH